VQALPRGTGDAAIKGLARVRRGLVLILSGDAPYLKRSSVEQMIQLHRRHRSDLTVVCAELADPGVYGRVIVGPNGQIRRIVEQIDASPQEKRVRLINGGMYLADADLLKKALTKLRPNNRQREYYLTDAVRIIIGQRGRVFPFVLKDASEVLGVNSKEELAEMRRLIKDDFYRELMRAGVLIEDPASTTIDLSVTFGREVVIKPNTVIEGATRIGDNCVIGPHVWIRNRSLKRHTRLAFRKLVREA
jgi:bifunctional UDP-N-acetylglucosamine pyrophosphorylase/glucosamine-1-phosphate N-acetyltransferase